MKLLNAFPTTVVVVAVAVLLTVWMMRVCVCVVVASIWDSTVIKGDTNKVDLTWLDSRADDSDSSSQRPRSRSVQGSPQLSPLRSLAADYDVDRQAPRDNHHHHHKKNLSR